MQYSRSILPNGMGLGGVGKFVTFEDDALLILGKKWSYKNKTDNVLQMNGLSFRGQRKGWNLNKRQWLHCYIRKQDERKVRSLTRE